MAAGTGRRDSAGNGQRGGGGQCLPISGARIGPAFATHPALVALANNLPFRDGLARAAAARGDLRAAIGIYRRLNQPDITAASTSVLEPRFVLAVGGLSDRAGDRETARAEYTRFLELWQDADDALPELGEARRYLPPGDRRQFMTRPAPSRLAR